MFSLCEDSGYLWDCFIYVGKNCELNLEEEELERRTGKSGAAIISLIKELTGLAIIFMLIIGTLANRCLNI